jgi:hypothetical protein
MNRIVFSVCVAALSTLAACGSNKQSVCESQIPAPAACMVTCDPQPGAMNSCPGGYHCSPDGKCDAECTPLGGQCGDGYTCTNDGTCIPGDSGSGSAPDANCPAVHFTAMPTTPSIELLIDGSGSMDTSIGGGQTRYTAIREALVGTQGVVTTLKSQIYFGAAIFTDAAPCPTLFKAPRMLNNTAIQTLIDGNSPAGATPTPPSIDQVVADFAANPPPMGSPPVIVLATDGLPNSCGGANDTQAESIVAAKASYAAGVRLFILGIAGINNTFLQQMANAGQGVQPGQPNAMYYTANSPASLSTAFQAIIGGVLSCDLTISGQVDPATAMGGTVTLNGHVLMYGTDWTVVNGTTIHLLGAACTELKSTPNPTVDASFPCGSVIL